MSFVLTWAIVFIRKSWLKEILKQYPQVDETELKTLISVKDSEISYSKIVTHDNQDLIVYFSDKIPYFFKNEKDNQLIPTGREYFCFKIIMHGYTTRIYACTLSSEILHHHANMLLKCMKLYDIFVRCVFYLIFILYTIKLICIHYRCILIPYIKFTKFIFVNFIVGTDFFFSV